MKELLLQKIQDKSIIAGVVGLGYVGLPLAVEKAKAGFRTIGFDVQKEKVDLVNAGRNYIGDVVDSELASLVREGRLSATTDFRFIRDVDFVAICVPTPLESTTYPGTTEELIKPILESSGLKCGEDFYLGFSPERVDPGNLIYKTKNTPKVVGGLGADASEVISAMYEAVLQGKVFRASSPAVAEMTKILENTYRNINIGLINELAILCHKMGINLWEVIEAAKTKPFGFTPFYPGPGLGGHCIPLDPYYLSWKAREYGFHTSMIESSMMINDRMPEYCVERIADMLNHRFAKALKGAEVLVLGVAYKQDIDDYRESPAIRVIEELRKEGARIRFYDPYVPRYRHKGVRYEGEEQLTASLVEEADIVVITTAHTTVDYGFVQQHARAIFDTKNVTKALTDRDNIEVL